MSQYDNYPPGMGKYSYHPLSPEFDDSEEEMTPADIEARESDKAERASESKQDLADWVNR
jgi:hypothetical protein